MKSDIIKNSPEEITYNLLIKKPFGNLFRKQHILIVCLTPDNKVLLGGKSNYYPKNVARFIGGGIEKSDLSLAHAAKREVQEELGIVCNLSSLRCMFIIHTKAVDEKTVQYSLDTHIFFFQLPEAYSAIAGDDVNELVILSVDELKKLSEHYLSLPEDSYCEDGNLTFSWQDYGKVYGPIHGMVADYLDQEFYI